MPQCLQPFTSPNHAGNGYKIELYKYNTHYALNSEIQIPKSWENKVIHILGFDIMIDSKLRPYLLEVNQMPSF